MCKVKVKFKFKNGELVEDSVSGFKGIIDCSSLWLNGCRRYSVQPKIAKGATEKPDSIWVDEESLIRISDGVSKVYKPTKTGGPYGKSDSCRF